MDSRMTSNDVHRMPQGAHIVNGGAADRSIDPVTGLEAGHIANPDPRTTRPVVSKEIPAEVTADRRPVLPEPAHDTDFRRAMSTTLPTPDRLRMLDRVGLALVVVMSLMPLTTYTFFG